MRFLVEKGSACSEEIELVVVLLFEDRKNVPRLLSDINRAHDDVVDRVVNQDSFAAKKGSWLLLRPLPAGLPQRVALLGLGKREEFTASDLRHAGALAVKIATKTLRAKTMAISFTEHDETPPERAAQFIVEGILMGSYRFDRYQRDDEQSPHTLEAVSLLLSEEPTDVSVKSAKTGVNRAEIVAEATLRARDLTNEPPNKLTPSILARYAEKLAEHRGLECRIYGRRDCEKMKMGLFLAVSQGSCEEPQFIHLKYIKKNSGKASRPKHTIVLIGKGVTFDSGGLSLKPSSSMLDMKADMAGAATVIGVMAALPLLGLDLEIHALVAATENMPSGSACRIGDVVEGLSGKSVEIVNTDAEGRLTLADALTFSARLEPTEIIDVATLTGACLVALGKDVAGLMGTDLAMVERFRAAARRAGEDVWPLPLTKSLRQQLDSPVADLKNSGDRWGGASIAGLFLKEFVPAKAAWIHLDIAGPSFSDKSADHISKGATGFGVPSLIEYLSNRETSS